MYVNNKIETEEIEITQQQKQQQLQKLPFYYELHKKIIEKETLKINKDLLNSIDIKELGTIETYNNVIIDISNLEKIEIKELEIEDSNDNIKQQCGYDYTNNSNDYLEDLESEDYYIPLKYRIKKDELFEGLGLEN